MKLIPSMVSAVFPPTDKTGKSFPEHCGGQTPTPHHHVSSRRFKQREGLSLRAVSSVPEGTPAPGAGGVTPPETSPALALGQRSFWSRGAVPLPRGWPRCSARGSPAAPKFAVTPSAAFNQLLQLVNFTQRPKEQTTGRQECRFLQLVQRASGSPASWPGEPCSAAGTCHIPGGDMVWRGLPHTHGSLWQCHTAAGGVWRDPGSFSLGKT